MLLVLDVGNTHIVVGVYRGEELLQHWRLHTNQKATEDEYGIMLHNLLQCEKISTEEITGIAISSVVPPVTSILRKLAQKYYQLTPLILSPDITTGLVNLCDHPTELGADRIANAVAAINKYGTPLIIVDFGTATTFCVIDEEGRYTGGAIAPGVNISAEALYQAASKLTRVEIRKPSQVIAKNTTEAVQSGIYFGYAGLIDGIITRMKEQLPLSPKVIATGGLSQLIASETKTIDEVDSFLTLEGLRLIFCKNRELCDVK